MLSVSIKMKTSQKKGKSPSKLKKTGKVSPNKPKQSNTIISMFKNQKNVSKKLENTEGTTQKNSLHAKLSKGDNKEGSASWESDDSDIVITKVEQKSEKFSSVSSYSGLDKEHIRGKHKKLKLSLKKSVSRESELSEDKCAGNSESEFNSVNLKCRHNPRSSQEEKHRACSSEKESPSLKCNSNKTSLKEIYTDSSEDEFTTVTLKQDCDPFSSSQKENSYNKVVHEKTSKRLSLLKRKSSTSNFVSKRRRISSETPESSQKCKLSISENPEKSDTEISTENSGKYNMETFAGHSEITNMTEIIGKGKSTGTEKNDKRYMNEKQNKSKIENKNKSNDVSLPERVLHSDEVNSEKLEAQQNSCIVEKEKGTISHKVKSKLSRKKNVKESNNDKDSQSLVKSVSVSDSSECLVQSENSVSGTEGVINEDVVNQTEENSGPYYLENFRTLIRTVMEDKDTVCLFNDDDMKYITGFSQLSESAQKLYVRIFSRKWAWLPVTKIKYPEIDEDITTVVEELAQSNYFFMSGKCRFWFNRSREDSEFVTNRRLKNLS
ncbi:hypothetical protein KUTeg_017728 [Tegillarca granosa]|uniref:Fanconi-associated nuclease n=1 Tax=Tegillarca granosa TaxID=220873 RepID=A0ABQ9EG25_TEGGR|nr:hypothetical protein KUTeg_017728 [Tegillarca granosa]